jgi:AbrB family looped-hinge helix DNA binding protein
MDNAYNGAMAMSYVMKVSRNGQVSIPAEARARWGAERVVVVDLGDRVVLRPVTPGGIDELVGKYADTGPSTDALRAAERRDEARREGRGR